MDLATVLGYRINTMRCVTLVAISWAVALTGLNHLDSPCCCSLMRSSPTPQDSRSTQHQRFPGFICSALLTMAPDRDSFYLTPDAPRPVQVDSHSSRHLVWVTMASL